jgi:hypothetical protein
MSSSISTTSFLIIILSSLGYCKLVLSILITSEVPTSTSFMLLVGSFVVARVSLQ